MKDKIITGFGIVVLVSALLLIMKCKDSYKESSSDSNIKIENAAAINEFIIGRWSTSFNDLGTTWYYRFEITSNQLKYWTRFGEWEWKTEPDEIFTYELSHIIRDTYGTKFRTFTIGETDLGLNRGGGLTFENGCLSFKNRCLEKDWK